MAVLPDVGILVDSSVAPLRHVPGGPDHFLAPADPYWTGIGGPNGKRLLEAPTTQVPLLPGSPRLTHALARRLPGRAGDILLGTFMKTLTLGVNPVWMPEATMVAFPDPSTFQLVAWRPSDRPVARLFCDVKNPDGTPFAADSRYVLKRLLKKAADLGYTYYVGPELEFFLFANSSEPKILDFGGYFDAPPRDLANDVRRDINFALESMRFSSNHGISPPSWCSVILRA